MGGPSDEAWILMAWAAVVLFWVALDYIMHGSMRDKEQD